MNRSKLIVILLLVAAVAAFFAFDLGRFLSLDALRAQQATLATLYAERPLALIGVYFLVYVAVTALSLPGATILTLAGGAVFGLWVGTLVVSFASSIGATLAFLASRYLLRDAVQAALRRAPRGHRRGHREGRCLLPVHAAPGAAVAVLRRQPADGADADEGARRSIWVSQIGMLAGTMVYVNAGTAARAPRLAARHPLAGADRLVRAARRLSAGRPQGARRCSPRARSMRVGAGEAEDLRPQPDRDRRRLGRPGVELHRRRREGQGDADRRRADGRRLPQLRLRAEQGADPHRDARRTRSRIRPSYGIAKAEATIDFADGDGAGRGHRPEDRAARLGRALHRARRRRAARRARASSIRGRSRSNRRRHEGRADDAQHRRRHRRRAVRAAAAGARASSAA